MSEERKIKIGLYGAGGILGWKSVLNNSASYKIVDFRDKKAREIFRNDDWNPDPDRPCRDKPPLQHLRKDRVLG